MEGMILNLYRLEMQSRILNNRQLQRQLYPCNYEEVFLPPSTPKVLFSLRLFLLHCFYYPLRVLAQKSN